MSTGAECNFIEKEVGEWYLHLQLWPYGDSDEYEDYGPYPTFNRAHDRLGDFANPGGYSTRVHADHVHKYHEVTEWNDEKVSQCIGCSDPEPVVLDCADKCIDYHKDNCGEYIVHMNVRMTLARLRELVAGEASTEILLPALEAELKRTENRR
jgi:hypothetical protein